MRRIHTVLGMRGGSLLSAVCKSSSSRLPMITRRRHFSLDATMWIQAGLQQIQISTGLPWWATFASSTALVRVGLFPLVRRQHLASRQLAGAMPELNFLYQLLLRRLSGLNPLQVGERLRILSIFLKGVNACLSLHSASVVTVFVYPLANMAVFVTFVYSLRGMISSDQRPELQEGGFAWFTDLTQKDTSFLLPFLAIGVSYTALENALLAGATGGNQARFVVLVKDIFQTLLIVSIPVVSTLPAGVFFYWIPSSLCGIAQTYLMRSPLFLKLVRIPPLPSPPITKR